MEGKEKKQEQPLVESLRKVSSLCEGFETRVEELRSQEGGSYREGVSNTSAIIIGQIDLLLLDMPLEKDESKELERALLAKKRGLILLIRKAVAGANEGVQGKEAGEISDEALKEIKGGIEGIREDIESLIKTLEQ